MQEQNLEDSTLLDKGSHVELRHKDGTYFLMTKDFYNKLKEHPVFKLLVESESSNEIL